MTSQKDPRLKIVDHLPAMRAFAISLCRNNAEADDMVQDTVIKAWSQFDKFEVGTNLRAWLFTILRNTYYSSRRRRRREVADPEGLYTARLSIRPDHDGRLQLADFRKALDLLPDEQREALILVGASGFSYEESAEMCGVALGTIKSRVNRARARLTELLGLDDGPMELTDPITASLATD